MNYGQISTTRQLLVFTIKDNTTSLLEINFSYHTLMFFLKKSYIYNHIIHTHYHLLRLQDNYVKNIYLYTVYSKFHIRTIFVTLISILVGKAILWRQK